MKLHKIMAQNSTRKFPPKVTIFDRIFVYRVGAKESRKRPVGTFAAFCFAHLQPEGNETGRKGA
ncbi:MAG TPA: hypothetical protein GXZ77_02090 [Papillibacter sp.]|nr:hypothetical protein [Papillibacter sp.]